MTDHFSIIPFRQLSQIIFNQLEKGVLFGVPKDFFFTPYQSDPFRFQRYGQLMENPIGVAAGPHTQLAQNIILSWLCGARYIELKTIQTLDELQVSKPCIDMQDEGYNCEWSQELKIHESFDQYLNAWILIHLLKDKLNIGEHDQPGFIFNMSVGYNLEGILKDNVQWFFDKMTDASVEIIEKLKTIQDLYPNAVNLKINSCLSDNITLSTMHGCPPEEIETIGKYLIEKRKLHTTIKLNPTLLGKEMVRKIVKDSGFETEVPDLAFDHDPKYEEALYIINSLSAIASDNEVDFGIKLTNTLESNNHKEVFPEQEKMMYMSGKVLHPIAINLAAKLQFDLQGKLDISFSAGIHADNIQETIACGLYPATVCSDILKPGGYGLLFQYLNNLRINFADIDANDMNEFIIKSSDDIDIGLEHSIVSNLKGYSSKVLNDNRYKKTGLRDKNIKTARNLTSFDCIEAPCACTCPTNQDIPDYMYYTSKGEFDKAFEVIMEKNPFPRVTGMVCDHLCQTKCTRINYDSPVLIREVKRFIAENAGKDFTQTRNKILKSIKVAIIGAGPAGLSCAYYLALAGCSVEVYETKNKSGGMVSGAIPSFRLTADAYKLDLGSIREMGVEIHYQTEIDKSKFEDIQQNSNYIFIATGARISKRLKIEGIDHENVIDPLQFLFDIKNDQSLQIGKNVAIIGGGNTAMDAARTAYRLVGKEGKVTIVYRRMINQMPADLGEVKAVMEEGIEIFELTSPLRIESSSGLLKLKCQKMKLGEKDKTGRQRPIEIPNSEFELEFDAIIPAIGQELDIEFIEPSLLSTSNGSYETKMPNIFIGGDALRGASTAINAIGDGRKAAKEILQKAGVDYSISFPEGRNPKELKWHIHQRNLKIKAVEIKETSIAERKNFNLVSTTLTADEAIAEASRCLLCDEVCNICTTLCPNLALHAFETDRQIVSIPKIEFSKGKQEIVKESLFEIKQEHQILHIADWCNECGNCTTFCPSRDAPYKVKPHLYLNKEAFMADNEVYFLNPEGELLYKKGNQVHSFKSDLNSFIYSFENTQIIIDKLTFTIIKINTEHENDFVLSMEQAAKMKVILEGAESFING
jgi:putative selenate reductase